MKSRIVLRSLKEACIKSKERLYLTNSQDIVKLIQEFNMIERYPWLVQMIKDGVIKKSGQRWGSFGSTKNQTGSASEAESQRQQKVRQRIYLYTENN